MKLKNLLGDGKKEHKFKVLGVVSDGVCDSYNFLFTGQKSYQSNREGLLIVLEHIAEFGFNDLGNFSKPAGGDKNGKIYEIVKGDLRLFYFKGEGDEVVICTDGCIKKTQKANKKLVEKTLNLKNEYQKLKPKNQISYE